MVTRQVCLCQHHHRLCAALPGLGKIPLQPGNIEILIERLYHEHRVEISGNRLLCGAAWHRVPPGKEGTARQSVQKHAVSRRLIGDLHKISHRGKFLCSFTEINGAFQPAVALPLLTNQPIPLFVHSSHSGKASRFQTVFLGQKPEFFPIDHAIPPVLFCEIFFWTRNIS